MRFLSFLLFRTFGFFVGLLPYSGLRALGNFSGSIAFYLHRPFRKKAMTNLAIAFHETKSEAELKAIAKKSFQSLMITLLEFFRFKKSKGNLSEFVLLDENSEIRSLLERKQGVVFLSAHQANWEAPFLALTNKFKGIAIGKPIKNKKIYEYILSIREMNGGKIVMPKNAIRAGMKALQRGEFLGIVGDQAYPDSPYSYPLFGTRAWTASTPALLAYKTGCPLIAGTNHRINGKYYIAGSKPIWPNLDAPVKEEVTRMMDTAMHHLEKSILEMPEQWMWVHDRWKQQGIDHVKRKYRFGFILITLPPDPRPYMDILPVFRKIYPRSFLTFFVPRGTRIDLEDCTVKEYDSEKDLQIRDWRFQMVFDFYDSSQLRKHFKKLGAFQALGPDSLGKGSSIKEALIKKLVKPECRTVVSS